MLLTFFLADSRVKLFISHLGLNSYTELAYAGIPTVSIPFFADQEYNAGTAQRKGIGLLVRKEEFTTENFGTAVKTVLNEEKFTKRAKLLSKMLQSNRNTKYNEFLDHIEYAIQFPETSELLELPTAHMDFKIANSYDVIALFFSTFLIFLFISVYITFKIVNLVYFYKNTTKNKVKNH